VPRSQGVSGSGLLFRLFFLKSVTGKGTSNDVATFRRWVALMPLSRAVMPIVRSGGSPVLPYTSLLLAISRSQKAASVVAATKRAEGTALWYG